MHNYLKFKSCYKKTMKNAKPECVLRFHMLQQHWMPCRNSDFHHWKTLKNKSTSRTRIFAPNPSKTMRRQNPKIRGNYKPIPSFHKVAKNLLIINLKNAFPVFSKVAQGLQGGTCRTPIPRPPSLTDVCFLPLGTEFSSHVWHSERSCAIRKSSGGILGACNQDSLLWSLAKTKTGHIPQIYSPCTLTPIAFWTFDFVQRVCNSLTFYVSGKLLHLATAIADGLSTCVPDASQQNSIQVVKVLPRAARGGRMGKQTRKLQFPEECFLHWKQSRFEAAP